MYGNHTSMGASKMPRRCRRLSGSQMNPTGGDWGAANMRPTQVVPDRCDPVTRMGRRSVLWGRLIVTNLDARRVSGDVGKSGPIYGATTESPDRVKPIKPRSRSLTAAALPATFGVVTPTLNAERFL